MDPDLLEELDELDGGGAALLRTRAHEAQEEEWQQFVQRRELERRRRRGELHGDATTVKVDDSCRSDKEASSEQRRGVARERRAPGGSRPVHGNLDRSAAREGKWDALVQRQQDRHARLPPPPSAARQQQPQEEPSGLPKDPFAHFCQRIMMSSRRTRDEEERYEAGEQSDARSSSSNRSEADNVEPCMTKADHKIPCGLPSMSELLKQVEKEDRREMPRALRKLVAEIDKADQEDREFEALKPLLPNLERSGGGGQQAGDVLAKPLNTDRHPLLKLAVRYMQSQRTDLDFEELYMAFQDTTLQAGKLKEASEGTVESKSATQQQLLVQERILKEERHDIRRGQWKAAREAAEARGRGALAAAPKNTKIVSTPAASSSDLWWPGASGHPQLFGAGVQTRAAPPPSASSSHIAGCGGSGGSGGGMASSPSSSSAAAPRAATGGGPGPQAAPNASFELEVAPPLLAVPAAGRGRGGAAAKAKGRLAAGQQPGPQRTSPAAASRIQQQQPPPPLPPEKLEQLAQARQRDAQLRLQRFREAWRQSRGADAAGGPTVAPPDTEID